MINLTSDVYNLDSDYVKARLSSDEIRKIKREETTKKLQKTYERLLKLDTKKAQSFYNAFLKKR